MLEIPLVLSFKYNKCNSAPHAIFFVKRKKKKKRNIFLHMTKVNVFKLKLSKIIHFVPFDTTPTGCCQIQQDIMLRHVYSK